MKLSIQIGDVLDQPADVLISTANPQLNMSGGVNGAILLRGGQAVQEELHEHLKRRGLDSAAPGSVVRTDPGPLAVKHVPVAVAVDAFYDSSVDLLRATIEAALCEAQRLHAATVVMPSLATGYGPLTMDQFAEGLRLALQRPWPPIQELKVVLRREDDAAVVRAALDLVT